MNPAPDPARRHAMYSTCLFCHRPLGANQVIEPFPVGRRLAFDTARGRLWVVCPSCGRWNLTALEERWEAMEECERRFRDTTRRVSTENIGLATVPGGVELVRVGRPLRPEFAAWRYGSELVRRRTRDLLGGIGAVGGSLAGLGAATAAPALLLTPIAGALGPLLFVGGSVALVRALSRKVVARAVEDSGEVALIRARDLQTASFLPGESPAEPVRLRLTTGEGPLELRGDAASRVAAVACARRNQIGGSRRYVVEAAKQIDASGGPDQVLVRAGQQGDLRGIRYLERLALEMALHEDAERRALEGELQRLEEAWREAEEIASIADHLLLPASVDSFIRRVRGRPGAAPPHPGGE